jgi:hypothetical protein
MKTTLGILLVILGFIGIFSPYMLDIESLELHYFLSSLSLVIGVGLFYDRSYSNKIKSLKDQRKLSDKRFSASAIEVGMLRAELRAIERAYDDLQMRLQQEIGQYQGVELMIKDLLDETLSENVRLMNQITGLKLTIARYKKIQSEMKAQSELKECNLQKRSVHIVDSDIATIEALHDLLLDTHGYSLGCITLIRARELTDKMYMAFK